MSDSIPDDQTKTARSLGEPPRWDEEKTQGLHQIGGFRLIRVLGSGGMGIVYEAEDPVLHRSVAIKSIKPEYAVDTASQERFLQEARMVAAIEHENVVPVYAAGADSSAPYLVMPLLRGETLAERLARSAILPLVEVIAIARDIAAGLAAVHARGLIHRDIKPSNVWIDAESGRARIFDFGLARATAGSALSQPGTVLGTPAYMAPEQAVGQSVDHRADLFSFGCVLYQMLVGTRPFSGTDILAVLTALAVHHPPAPHLVNPVVPLALSETVERLLSKSPHARLGSAKEVLERLAQCETATLASKPEAGTETRSYRTEETIAPALPKSNTEVFPLRSSPAPVAHVTFGRALLLVFALTVVLAVYIGWRTIRSPNAAPVISPDPIIVGVLHSQSGTMAVSENPVIDATVLAIEEINAAGGVQGRLLKPLVVDGRSDPDEFAKQAEYLLRQEKAAVVFGCWTSASRKAVRPVLERNAGLLFYPVQYEGLEESPRIVYLGPAPNQQLIPAIDYAIDVLKKKRIALVGSDYVFPRAAHAIIKDWIGERKKAGVDVEVVVSDAFVPLGSPDVRNVIARVRNANADVVINTLNGTTNAAFFRELREPNTGVPGITTLSVSITENEVLGLNARAMTDDYLVASYFHTVDRPESREFVRKIQAKYGGDRAVSDMMAAAYTGVHLWAKAANSVSTIDPSDVIVKVRGSEFDGPGGRIKIDPENQHAWLPVRIAKVQPSGEVALVTGAGSEVPIRAIPLPPTRPRDEWNQFLRKLEMDWGGKWQAPRQ